MTEQLITAVDRRRFLTQVVPACSLACLCVGIQPELQNGADRDPDGG
jgi:hypothetical protein